MKLVLKSVLQFFVSLKKCIQCECIRNSASATIRSTASFATKLYVMLMPNITLALLSNTIALTALPKGIASIAIAGGVRRELALL